MFPWHKHAMHSRTACPDFLFSGLQSVYLLPVLTWDGFVQARWFSLASQPDRRVGNAGHLDPGGSLSLAFRPLRRPNQENPCTSPKNRGMMKEEPPKAFQADLFVLFHKWPHPVCLLLFRLQPSHYCVLHNSALVGSSPHMSPTSPRRESGDTWICRSCRRSQRTSSADVTHFTLYAFHHHLWTGDFFFFVCGCDGPNSGLSQRLTPRVLQDYLKLRCTCLSSGLSPTTPTLALVLSIHTHTTEQFSLSCHRPSYLSQQPGSLLAYLPHFKGKQARRFKKRAFSGRLAPPHSHLPPPRPPGLSTNAVRLLNVCFPCLMMPVCISQPLNPR